MPAVWRKCSSCKSDIFCNSEYMICSVSTCQQKRTNYVFCSMECWDRHIPVERHRSDNISAIVKRAPSQPEAHVNGVPNEAKRRVVVATPKSSTTARVGSGGGEAGATSVDGEVLVVASKVKKYISELSGMNTSASTLDELTEKIKEICREAIQNARRAERKTVMDRDVPKIHFVSKS